MDPLRDISQTYLRWRHSHGYGVHSPFAYNFVKTVVRPGSQYAYYGYFDIDQALTRVADGDYPRLRRDAMLLLRTIVFLRSRRLLLTKILPAFEAAAKSGGAQTIAVRKSKLPDYKPDDIMLIRRTLDIPGEITRRLSAGTTVMAIDPTAAVRDSLMTFESRGLLLTGKRIIIAIPNPDMAFVSYQMKM